MISFNSEYIDDQLFSDYDCIMEIIRILEKENFDGFSING